jgi:hypothetical protein
VTDVDAPRTYAKWQGWIEVIADDVDALHQSRETFGVVVGEYEKKYPESGPRWSLRDSVLYHWIGDLFSSRAAISVRRQADPERRSDAISLGRLLAEIAANPDVLTRDRFHDLFRDQGFSQEHVDQWFDKFAGEGQPRLPKDVVLADIERLEEASQVVRTYADKRIAHWDRRAPTTLATWGDLDRAIDTLWQLAAKYRRILRNETMIREAYPPDWFDK